MKEERVLNILGQVDEKYIKEADPEVKSKKKTPIWTNRAAMAACLTVVLAIIIPYFLNIADNKGGQDDPLRPLNVIEYNGAYYEVVDMDNTRLLDAYNLPHEITKDMIGAELGKASDNNDNQTNTVYQYVPYSEIAITEEAGDKRFQRAVYVVSYGEKYSFALFCNYIHFDTNTHQEASEMFAVYGVDSADDIGIIEIDGKAILEYKEIEAVFNAIYKSQSMGNDDYQKEVYGNMSEAEQQKRSKEIADSSVEIRMITKDGLLINNLSYSPLTNHIHWSLNYYKLNAPINMK